MGAVRLAGLVDPSVPGQTLQGVAGGLPGQPGQPRSGAVSGALFELDVHPVPGIAGQICTDDITGWFHPAGQYHGSGTVTE